MAEQHQKIPPKSKAMLICDQVIIERDTNKISVISSYNSVPVWRESPETKPFCVFLKLTEGNPTCDITMEMHDLREDRVISRLGPQTVQFADRLEAVEVVGSWPAVPIEHDGAYDIVAFADSQEIDRHRLQIYFQEEQDDEETQ